MPTRLGNILRAAERRISAKYGLEPRICWSRLWGVMSKDDREAWSASRATLDIGARSFMWSGLFVCSFVRRLDLLGVVGLARRNRGDDRLLLPLDAQRGSPVLRASG